MDIRKDARGESPRKRVKRAVRDHQRRLQQLCADRRDGFTRDGRKTVQQVLSVLGHCVRLMFDFSIFRTLSTDI